MELEQDMFLARFNQYMKKECENASHDWHIKLHTFKVNELVLIYDSKFTKFPGKFQMHWLRPYVVKEIIGGGAVQLVKLNGEILWEESMGVDWSYIKGCWPAVEKFVVWKIICKICFLKPMNGED